MRCGLFPRVDAQGERGGGGSGGEREAGAFHFIMKKNVLNMLSSHAPLFLSALSSSSLFFSLILSPLQKGDYPKKKSNHCGKTRTNGEKRGKKKRAGYLNYAQKTQKPGLKKGKKTVFILSLICLV